MRFEKIETYRCNTIDPADEERLRKFAKDFNVVGYYDFYGLGFYKDYLERLLTAGSRARLRSSDEKLLTEYWTDLFDHGMFLKTKDGRVILVSMVYRSIEFVEKCYAELKEKYNLDDRIKMKVMDQKYNFYWRDSIKTTMLLFYAEDDLK